MHEELLKQYFSSDIRALAKLLTLVESRAAGFEEVMSKVSENGAQSYCIGITGPPGAGKSTIVDSLTHLLRKDGKKVGIIAIDPSSPFSGGAVLGDRIRMQDHAGDDGVFIRSLGSRGSHGGLSNATRDIVRVVGHFGFDIVIVETVGVGQTELDIMSLADTTAVILVPEAGDTIQTMKAGLLEIADIFVVNKSDRPGADAISQSLTGLVEMGPKTGWRVPVIATNALKKEGIKELLEMIFTHREFAENDNTKKEQLSKMKDAELVQVTLELFEKRLREALAKDKSAQKILDQVRSGKMDVYAGAGKLLKKMEE